MAAAESLEDGRREASTLEQFLIAQAGYALQLAFPAAHRVLCRSAAELQVMGEADVLLNERERAKCRELLAAFEKRKLRFSMNEHGQPLLIATAKPVRAVDAGGMP